MFCQELPVFQLLGSKKCIDVDIPYDVDSDVQLVCKYLKACKEAEINDQYDDFLPDRLVKFSSRKDLPDKDCHQLLHEYMPEHVVGTKITQRLFIKYVIPTHA